MTVDFRSEDLKCPTVCGRAMFNHVKFPDVHQHFNNKFRIILNHWDHIKDNLEAGEKIPADQPSSDAIPVNGTEKKASGKSNQANKLASDERNGIARSVGFSSSAIDQPQEEKHGFAYHYYPDNTAEYIGYENNNYDAFIADGNFAEHFTKGESKAVNDRFRTSVETGTRTSSSKSGEILSSNSIRGERIASGSINVSHRDRPHEIPRPRSTNKLENPLTNSTLPNIFAPIFQEDRGPDSNMMRSIPKSFSVTDTEFYRENIQRSRRASANSTEHVSFKYDGFRTPSEREQIGSRRSSAISQNRDPQNSLLDSTLLIQSSRPRKSESASEKLPLPILVETSGKFISSKLGGITLAAQEGSHEPPFSRHESSYKHSQSRKERFDVQNRDEKHALHRHSRTSSNNSIAMPRRTSGHSIGISRYNGSDLNMSEERMSFNQNSVQSISNRTKSQSEMSQSQEYVQEPHIISANMNNAPHESLGYLPSSSRNGEEEEHVFRSRNNSMKKSRTSSRNYAEVTSTATKAREAPRLDYLKNDVSDYAKEMYSAFPDEVQKKLNSSKGKTIWRPVGYMEGKKLKEFKARRKSLILTQ